MTIPTRLQALLLLNEYDQQQKGAQDHQKKLIWNIVKARRQKSRENVGLGHGISALDVRDELRARTVLLQDSKVPSLIVEQSPQDIQASGSWELVDVVEKRKDIEEEKDDAAATSDTGLRNRKGNPKTEVQWTLESALEDEDEKILRADPIDLFGAFPPRDLRVAQREAKESIQRYIDAANAARSLLSLLEEKATE